MSSKYKFYDPDKVYFVSFAVVYWIDLFVRNEYKDIILDIIGSSHNKPENIMRDLALTFMFSVKSYCLVAGQPCNYSKTREHDKRT